MTNVDLAALLRACLSDIASLGAGLWSFALAPHLKKRARVELSPRWLSFRCAMPGVADEPPFAAILRQSAWRSGVKFVRLRSRILLHAEVPLLVQTAADRDWMSCQISEVVHGLRAANPDSQQLPTAEADNSGNTDPELLADRCRAAGWHAVVKPDGKINVDIQSRSVRRVVSIVPQAATLRAFVTLGEGEFAQASGECIAAAAHFLRRASSSLCVARAWAAGGAAAPSAAGFRSSRIPTWPEAPPGSSRMPRMQAERCI